MMNTKYLCPINKRVGRMNNVHVYDTLVIPTEGTCHSRHLLEKDGKVIFSLE